MNPKYRLKLCPFCGHKPVLVKAEMFQVVCQMWSGGCGCRTAEMSQRDTVIKAWDRRNFGEEGRP